MSLYQEKGVLDVSYQSKNQMLKFWFDNLDIFFKLTLVYMILDLVMLVVAFIVIFKTFQQKWAKYFYDFSCFICITNIWYGRYRCGYFQDMSTVKYIWDFDLYLGRQYLERRPLENHSFSVKCCCYDSYIFMFAAHLIWMLIHKSQTSSSIKIIY